MTRLTPITIIVHTRNSEKHLAQLLETTAWAAERIVIDMHSDDQTRGMAVAAGCLIFDLEAQDFNDSLRNEFLAKASYPWTLILDSDEYLAADARIGIERLIESAHDSVGAFALPRFNRIGDQIMRGSAWYPDHQVRLIRSDSVRFTPRHHVPPVLKDEHLTIQYLIPPHCVHIHHHNYVGATDFIKRQLDYAITDRYDTNPNNFDFAEYIASARAIYEARLDTTLDGNMSSALALAMFCDQIQRAIIHWERLGSVNTLDASLPLWQEVVYFQSEISKVSPEQMAEYEGRISHLQHDLDVALDSWSMKLTSPLRSLNELLGSARRAKGSNPQSKSP
jgi:hypothetical protein